MSRKETTGAEVAVAACREKEWNIRIIEGIERHVNKMARRHDGVSATVSTLYRPHCALTATISLQSTNRRRISWTTGVEAPCWMRTGNQIKSRQQLGS